MNDIFDSNFLFLLSNLLPNILIVGLFYVFLFYIFRINKNGTNRTIKIFLSSALIGLSLIAIDLLGIDLINLDGVFPQILSFNIWDWVHKIFNPSLWSSLFYEPDFNIKTFFGTVAFIFFIVVILKFILKEKIYKGLFFALLFWLINSILTIVSVFTFFKCIQGEGVNLQCGYLWTLILLLIFLPIYILLFSYNFFKERRKLMEILPSQSVQVVQNIVLQNQPVVAAIVQEAPAIKKSKKEIILGIILLVLTPIILYLYSQAFPAVFSYFYFFDYMRLSQDKSFAPKVDPQPTLSPNAVAQYKTFAGKYVGISFKYPKDWYEVDSKYVSQVPSDVVFGDKFQDYTKKGKIANMIWINRYPKDADIDKFNKLTKYYNSLKASKVDEEIVDIDYSDENLKKIKEGKLLGGQEYITYIKYMYDYKLENPKDENSKEIKYSKVEGIITLIKDMNTYYELEIEYYDKNGQNYFLNIPQTATINSGSIEDKTFDNDIFSFKYPSYSDLERSNTVRGDQATITPVTNSDLYYNSIFISYKLIDLKQFPDNNFRQKGTWWNEAICNYLQDEKAHFEYINGYPSIISQTEDQPNYYDVFIFNKPYVVHFQTEDENSIKFIKQIDATIKFKQENKDSVDPDIISYLKDQYNSSSESACPDLFKDSGN